MTGYVIGAIVATFVVAGFLLQDSDNSGRRRNVGGGIGTGVAVVLALLVLALVWGGGIAEFIGCVCIVLKILGVEPVASWSWFEAFLPLVGGVVAQVTGLIIREALD